MDPKIWRLVENEEGRVFFVEAHTEEEAIQNYCKEKKIDPDELTFENVPIRKCLDVRLMDGILKIKKPVIEGDFD
jgi:hypothetical protein